MLNVRVALEDLLADVPSSRSGSTENVLDAGQVVLITNWMLGQEDQDWWDQRQHSNLVLLDSGAEVIGLKVAQNDTGGAEKKTGHEQTEAEDVVEGKEEHDGLILVVPVLVEDLGVVVVVVPGSENFENV